jgi:hypothetical protein
MELRVYSRKEDKEKILTVDIGDEGWFVSNFGYRGLCDKTGAPYLLNCLRHSGSNYPPDLANTMKDLWDLAHTDNLSKDEIQKYLNEIGDWILLWNDEQLMAGNQSPGNLHPSPPAE